MPTSPGEGPTAPGTTDSGSAPTIASDLADYAPGGTVTLTGAGWQAGEDVTIVVNDTGGLSWSLNQKVVADSAGRLTLTFDLPARYVPDYDVTATGALSGVATTTFTDASQPYRFWMTQSAPSNTTPVAGGTHVTYNVYGQRTGTFSVADAVITLTLTGSATFDSLAVQSTGVTLIDPTTATWKPSSLGDFATTVGVKATVTSGAPAGSITATVSGDTNGTFSGGGGFLSLTHDVTGPTVGKCSFATGSGDFSRSICWFDLAGYNSTTAASANGQSMQQTLLNGYVLSYTIRATSTSTNVAAWALPTYTAAFLGNNGAGYVNNYQGIAGKPALYQQSAGKTILTLDGISLKDAAGLVVKGFALVGADAESTDSGESITWNSDKTITSIGPLGNSCAKALVMSPDNLQATCNPGPVANKTGAAIIYSQDPGTFSQTMVGSGLQAVAFGVMASGLQLNKQIVNQISGDQVSISVKRSDGTVLSTTTDVNTGYASTGQLYSISAGASSFTMSETAVAGTDLANYAATWACTKNGAPYDPAGASATTKTATVSLNDFVTCTITNTGPALTLRKSVVNTAGGILTPANWTLTATTSGSAPVIAEAPARSSTTTGKVTTASTANKAVPAGDYILGESSAVAGTNRYAGSAWSCTKAGTGTFPVNGSTLRLAAGNNVTCTITNTYVPLVTVTTTWVNGVSGDKTDLVINTATTSPGKVTSTSNGNLGSWTDAANVARATPAVGGTVSVAEAMPSANRGTYSAGLTCLDGNSNVTVSSGTFTMPNSDVTCDYTNRAIRGTVTWSKVDAGSASTLLTGSEWTLTGPTYPSPGTTVADCTLSPCAGPDTDPVAGQFNVPVLSGSHTLVEKTAPIGFQLDATVRTFAIATDAQIVAVGGITNTRRVMPPLPLTGGASTDAFLLAGYALIAAAGFAGWRQRRRLLRSL